MGNLDARIICTDRAAKNGPPLLVLIMNEIGHEYIYPYTEQGNSIGGDLLTTLPETKVSYYTVLPDGQGFSGAHKNMESAIKWGAAGVIKITVTGDDWDVEKVTL